MILVNSNLMNDSRISNRMSAFNNNSLIKKGKSNFIDDLRKKQQLYQYSKFRFEFDQNCILSNYLKYNNSESLIAEGKLCQNFAKEEYINLIHQLILNVNTLSNSSTDNIKSFLFFLVDLVDSKFIDLKVN